MKLHKCTVFGAALLAMCMPAFAHHSFGMFNLQKNVVYEGTVLQYNWENPHAHILLKIDRVAKDPSTVGTWDIEGQAVNIMTRQGWTHGTYKRGDHAIIVAHPLNDGSKGASLFYAIMPDGRRLYGDIARPGSNDPPTPDR
jgi:hypothetical protein